MLHPPLSWVWTIHPNPASSTFRIILHRFYKDKNTLQQHSSWGGWAGNKLFWTRFPSSYCPISLFSIAFLFLKTNQLKSGFCPHHSNISAPAGFINDLLIAKSNGQFSIPSLLGPSTYLIELISPSRLSASRFSYFSGHSSFVSTAVSSRLPHL